MTKDIKTTHEYKDLFCVSSLMLSDCKTHSDLKVSPRLPKHELKVYLYILHSTHILFAMKTALLGKEKKRTLRPHFSRVSLHVLGVSNYFAFSCEDL